MQTLKKTALLTFLALGQASAQTEILTPLSSTLSPDGKEIMFSWKGDIWKTPVTGGEAVQVTTHPAVDYRPVFTPDGKAMYFNSDRNGSLQIFKKSLSGGAAELFTPHTQTTILEDISLDGKKLLVRALRDAPGRNPMRLFTVDVDKEADEQLVFDTYANGGKLSPDGKKILFTREGVETYRKQYKGTQAEQIWIYDIASDSFSQPLKSDTGLRWPLWGANSKSFYYVSQQDGTFNLYQHFLKSGKDKQLTFFKGDGVILPSISDDGSTIVFRKLFHLYTLSTKKNSKPKQLELFHKVVDHQPSVKKTIETKTKDLDFTPSGLEMGFIANNDIFVMDTVLKEPVQVSQTTEYESNLLFGDKGQTLYYLKDDGIQTSIYKVQKKDPSQYWWKSSDFEHIELYQSAPTITSFTLSPDEQQIALATVDGRLIVIDKEGNNPVEIVHGWSQVYPTWSPDSKWLAFSQQNNDFNADIFVAKADGTQPPFNLTQHPDNEYAATWSPDGKKIAFIGRRFGSNYDIFVAELYQEEKSSRSKKEEAAEKAMAKDPNYSSKSKKEQPQKQQPKSEEPKKTEPKGLHLQLKQWIKSLRSGATEPKTEPDTPPSKSNTQPNAEPKAVPMKKKKGQQEPYNTPVKKQKNETPKATDVDKPFHLAGITKRFKRIKTQIPASSMAWSSDSKRLLVSGRNGSTITAFDVATGKPSKFADANGPLLRVGKADKVFMINKGVPSVISGGKPTAYPFKAYTELDRKDHFKHSFRLAWRTMGEGFYDKALNNLDWDQVRAKYEPAATNAPDGESFGRVISTMLGELNASHTGFNALPWLPKYKAVPRREAVQHLGVRFDKAHSGKGYKVAYVLPEGPSTEPYSQLNEGDIITHIAGREIDSDTPTAVSLMLPLGKEVELQVTDEAGEERTVKLMPISYSNARRLGQQAAIAGNEQAVEKLSKGTLGYIHIQSMMWDEFEKFERHIYEKGYGKQGLVIDVRDNGGGFTTDHLLTVLDHKRHAFTIPRNGGPGYPQDRVVYATWDKPIIVLCNQNSFSNAEIFTHAIKTLKRGKVVGVATAGGVISTGSKSIPNAGTIRFPFRGWFDLEGKDMEMNGAQPDIVLWPTPAEMARGEDKQLERAVQQLLKDVKMAKPIHRKPRYKSTK